MNKKLGDISKKEDDYSVGSNKRLANNIEKRMKSIYKSSLDYIELYMGHEEDFKLIRSKILGIGNDQIRSMRDDIENNYNVELIPQRIDFTVNGKDVEDGNN